MEFKIIWSDAALADLHDICSYLADRRPKAAKEIGEEYWITFKS